MRRRYVLTLALAIVLIFSLAGTAFGHYVWNDSQGEPGICIYYRAILAQEPASFAAFAEGRAGRPPIDWNTVLVEYDKRCR